MDGAVEAVELAWRSLAELREERSRKKLERSLCPYPSLSLSIQLESVARKWAWSASVKGLSRDFLKTEIACLSNHPLLSARTPIFVLFIN